MDKSMLLRIVRKYCLTSLTLALLTANSAQGASIMGYPCNVELFPTASSFGNHGHFLLVLDEGRNCQGLTVGWFYFCSEGADSRLCTQNTNYHYSENALYTLFSNVRSHLTTGRRVSVSVPSDCTNQNCGGNIRFWAQ